MASLRPFRPISLALALESPHLVTLPIAAILLGLRLRRKWTPDPLASMLPAPASKGQFRTRVEYRRDGIVTGRDEMALCVVDGWLVAEGVRSHFALRCIDVGSIAGPGAQGCTLRLSEVSEIVLSHVADAGGRVLLARPWIEAWQRTGHVPEGEPIFPPARVHPAEIARWSAWPGLGIVICLSMNLFGTLVGRGAEGRISLMITGFLVGGVVLGLGANRLKRLLQIEAQAKRQDALAGQTPALQEKAPEPLTAKRW